ncbi:zinc-binding dehydrogenase [Corynebacterium caspium]|uniref:zinc-binding dehydrogenase n=1 Tax=Corynebacterium caspium TaxID=234828 RepID=UPI000362E661|nr:zinc-binding dehydrogenase [Corynebacterium caspium]WKD59747.1 L-idonate 5-dehydrogenase (NAD(P)(+)) [Corynebacterium caspium DSM 44850]
MRAVLIHGKEDLRIQEVPTPSPGSGEVLIRVAYAGICGSDLHYYYEGRNGDFLVREPLIPGHEISGIVAADPSGTFAPGTPVTPHPATFGKPVPGLENSPHLWPGGAYLGSASTWPHTQGGMSEYLLLRHDQVRVLPETLSLERAVLAEPTAVAMHAVSRSSGVAGKKVLVNGAGPIGLLTAGVLKYAGAAEIWAADIAAGPLKRATALGITGTIDLSTENIPDESFDVVFECAGVFSAISAAIRAVRRRGEIIQVGMVPGGDGALNIAPLIAKEAALIGVFRFRDEVDAAVELLNAHPELETVLTHVTAADDAAAAFATARDSRVSGKVALNMWFAD